MIELNIDELKALITERHALMIEQGNTPTPVQLMQYSTNLLQSEFAKMQREPSDILMICQNLCEPEVADKKPVKKKSKKK